MRNYDLTAEIIKLSREGLPVFGTCAGMVLMANDIPDNSVESLGLMDITVIRNAFGRQRESFETELKVPVLGEEPFPGKCGGAFAFGWGYLCGRQTGQSSGHRFPPRTDRRPQIPSILSGYCVGKPIATWPHLPEGICRKQSLTILML
jgi:hypothetical protein